MTALAITLLWVRVGQMVSAGLDQIPIGWNPRWEYRSGRGERGILGGFDSRI